MESIQFEGFKFNLPMSLEEAIQVFGIDFQENSFLFRKGDINNREILVYTDMTPGEPIGSPNLTISKKQKMKTVYGVTFYRKPKTPGEGNWKSLINLHENYRQELAKTYNLCFDGTVELLFFVSPFGEYYFITPSDKLTIVVGDVAYQAAENEYVTISFFYDISEKNLKNSLGFIY